MEWVSYFKYKCLAFYAYYESEKTDLYPKPKGIGSNDKDAVIFGGIVLSWQKMIFKDLKHKRSSLALSFILSINMAKMGMPRPDDAYVQKKVKETATHLTTEPRPLPLATTFKFMGQEVILNKDSFKQELRRTAREVFYHSEYRLDDHYEPFFPSTSSNYNNTVLSGGCIAELYRRFNRAGLLDKAVVETDTVSAFVSERISQKFGLEGEEEQQLLDLDTESKTETKCLVYSDEPFLQQWKVFMDQLAVDAYVEEPLVQPVGLSEALKARVISKGPVLLYTYLKPLQKFLWRHLKKMSVFELIGKPVDENIINDLYRSIEPDEIIINGDYKASTDNLRTWVSETLADEIIKVLNENATTDCKIIDDRFKEMILRSLTGHVFYLGEVGTPKGVTLKPQLEGQLMGSITSFPFLCLANAAMCRWAIELNYQKTFKIVDWKYDGSPIVPLRVNGDDCTLKGLREPISTESPSLKDAWLKITKFGGLESSLGKTLYSLPHRPVVVINSRTFDRLDERWVERKFVNMGLMKGMKRSSVGTAPTGIAYEQLGSVHHELMRSCPVDMIHVINKRFIYFNKHTLKQYPNIPWNAPSFLGGPGLKPIIEMSAFDRKIASILIMNKSKEGDIMRKLTVQKVPSTKLWKVHMAVLDRFEKIGVSEVPFRKMVLTPPTNKYGDFEDEPLTIPYDIKEGYNRLYKLFCVESLYIHLFPKIYEYAGVDKDQKDLMEDLFHQTKKRLLWRNNRAWASAYEVSFSGEFCDVRVRSSSDLVQEKKEAYVPVIDHKTLSRIIDETRKLNCS
jgi:hypothetical protein